MSKMRVRSVIRNSDDIQEIRVIPQKALFEKGLSKIFSKEPSNFGYKFDIENLINEIVLRNEDFLYFTLMSLSKIVRNKNDTRIISSYLFSMPNLIKLLKGNNNDKKEQDIMKDLLYLSKYITYEKHEENEIIIRLGEIGTTAYIILKGSADVLLKNFKLMTITKYDYLYYLANLIRYNEYGLLNETINENFYIFPIDIEESKKIGDIFKVKEKPRNFTVQNIEESPINKNASGINFFNNKMETEQGILKSTREKKENKANIKLNINNIELKFFKNAYKITEEKLLELFNFKKIPVKNLNCSYTAYIERLKILPDDYKLYINERVKKELEEEERKRNENKENKESKVKKEELNENTIYFLKIYSYVKVNTMGKGTLFGDLALTQENSLRTATIIASSQCDMTVITRKVFNNCLKKGMAAMIKKLLSFFVNLPIFRGISEYFFYNKYYSYLSRKTMFRGNILINQGESPKGIILLYSGTYSISSKTSLNSLTDLILHLIKNSLDTKNQDLEKTKKYLELLKEITKIITNTKTLINENPKFEKFYNSEMNLRVTELSGPDIIGFKEYVNEQGLYSFTIEARSTENIYYMLDNKFYSQILHKNNTIRKNQVQFSEKKIYVMIHRLMILRNCLVKYFFKNKTEKIDLIISKELDNINDLKIKQKSELKKKISEYNFKNSKKEPEKRNKKLEVDNEIKNKNIISYYQIETSKNNNTFNKIEKIDKINSLSINKISKTTRNLNKKINDNKMAKLYKTSETKNKILIQKKLNITPKKSKIKMVLIRENVKRFNETFKTKEKLKKKNIFNERNKEKVKLPRKKSFINSYSRNIQSAGIIVNNIVLEELNKKIMNNLFLNNNSYRLNSSKVPNIINSIRSKSSIKSKRERLMTPLTPINYNKLIVQYKYHNLRKSGSESLFNKIRIKPRALSSFRNNQNKDSNTNIENIKKNLNILNIKRIFSPLEKSLGKNKEKYDSIKTRKSKEFHIDKSNKFRKNILNSRVYINNIKNRIKQYYNNCKK